MTIPGVSDYVQSRPIFFREALLFKLQQWVVDLHRPHSPTVGGLKNTAGLFKLETVGDLTLSAVWTRLLSNKF